MIVNRSRPQSDVVPVLTYEDVNAAADWLVTAFGCAVRLRIGDHRIQLRCGGGAVVLHHTDRAETDCSCSVLVAVEDADAHVARARAAGARITMEPTEFPFGERQYGAVDIGGHHWTFTQSIADVAPDEWGGLAVALD